MDNKRATLTGQYPQGAELSSQQALLLGIRAINVVLGVAGATSVAFTVQYPNKNHVGYLVLCVAAIVIVVLNHVIKRFYLKGYSTKFLNWFNVGAVVGALITFPMIITPTCGWLEDTCKPVQHQVHHAQ